MRSNAFTRAKILKTEWRVVVESMVEARQLDIAERIADVVQTEPVECSTGQ